MGPLRVGLLGAGAWAWLAHAPALRAGPNTCLAGVWSRRVPSAESLAAHFGTKAFARLPDLLDACEAVALSVPPSVQAELGVTVAKAGRALLLEKPLAADLKGAERLAEAIGESGVVSQLVLILRYSNTVRSYVVDALRTEPFAGQAAWLSGGALRGPSATPWRRELGAIGDLGPHVIDLMDAALGRVVGVRAHGKVEEWSGLLLEHEGGAVSEVSLSHRVPVREPVCRFVTCGRRGTASLDPPVVGPDSWATLTTEFARSVQGGEDHPLNAQHGLHLQRIIAAARGQLGGG
ncbi:Gfo/Idh/MocA family protein [Streptomyces sp. NPDC057620]|uniref:Gfo/Idh/MocA family protein n=1 Tax=Streptomyces sp. NPDC057620 TaxID=3346185 RepID=UPI00369039F3